MSITTLCYNYNQKKSNIDHYYKQKIMIFELFSAIISHIPLF
jgi:hypothetical protein